MTLLSRKLEVDMHRRNDGSNYDVAGLTGRLIFRIMVKLGPEFYC